MSGMVDIGTSLLTGHQEKKAAKRAARSQEKMQREGIAAQERMFEQQKELMSPYITGGQQAWQMQQQMMDPTTQAAVMADIENSPYFQTMARNAERAILANASATGTVRGSDTNRLLAQYRPALLQDLFNQRFTKLSGMGTTGANAASNVGASGMNLGINTATGLSNIGNARASGILNAQNARSAQIGAINDSVNQSLSFLTGAGGFGGFGAGGTPVGNGQYNIVRNGNTVTKNYE